MAVRVLVAAVQERFVDLLRASIGLVARRPCHVAPLDVALARIVCAREATVSQLHHRHSHAVRLRGYAEPTDVRPTTRTEAVFVVAKSVQSITRLLVEELNHASEIAGSAGAHVADHTAKRTNALVASRLCVLVEDLGARRARVQLLMLVEARDVNKHVVG